MNERVAQIVSAYLRKNRIEPAALPGLIASVSESLANLEKPEASSSAPAAPAVPIRRSVSRNAIICLECGYKAKMLKRHLMAAHGMTVDAYRKKWALPTNYSFVAANYATRRSELAKAIGLGRRRDAATV